jgi:predicted transcriptional regulator
MEDLVRFSMSPATLLGVSRAAVSKVMTTYCWSYNYSDWLITASEYVDI